jgi:ATP-GRASP peptide maturase of grasp-with-spasm system
MLFVQSNRFDVSTIDVLDWLYFLDGKINLRIFHDATVINEIVYKISNDEQENLLLKTDKGKISNKEIDAFWYRRGSFNHAPFISDQATGIHHSFLKQSFQRNFYREREHIGKCIYTLLQHNGKINTYEENFTNKITNLSAAKKVGLKIPDTLVTNNFEEVLAFLRKYLKILTKDIEFDTINFAYDEVYNVSIYATVTILTPPDIKFLKEKEKENSYCHFSLFQQYIEKKIELRIFYLNGLFYPMAIFSQENDKTKNDFRNYDRERPNRCIPYKLPENIESMLMAFMQEMKLDSGSIDMILTPEQDYVFLEVNPVGQFQWVSRYCNYDIERQIANQLLNHSHEKKM